MVPVVDLKKRNFSEDFNGDNPRNTYYSYKGSKQQYKEIPRKSLYHPTKKETQKLTNEVTISGSSLPVVKLSYRWTTPEVKYSMIYR